MKTLEEMNLEGPTLTPKNYSLPYRILYYFLKGKNFLIRYFRNPRFIAVYLMNFWRSDYRQKILFLNDDEYLERAKNVSTIRFGEGEFTLMLGTRDIIVQKFDPALQDFFYKVADEYDSDSPYLLAMSSHLSIANSDLEKHNARYLWMPGKVLFGMHFNPRAWYTDASFFYRDGMTERFLQTVTPGRHVVHVTNVQNISKLKNIEDKISPEAKSIGYVETPPASTFALRDQVLQEIRKTIDGKEAESVIIFACGPAGKVIARTLAHEGVLAHDVGSGIAFLFDNTSHEGDIGWGAFSEIFERNRDHDRNKT